jgi:hypothetical protein
MEVLSLPRALELIEHVGFRHRDPVYLQGQPGCGKTAGVTQLAAKHNAFLCSIRFAQFDSVDLRGFPGVTDGKTVWHVPSVMPFVGNEDKFPTDRPILLFLDEMNAGNPAVQAAGMQLLNEGGIGEHKLMPNVVTVGAGNRESDRGIANRMPTTTCNRLTFVEVAIDVNAYCEYRQTKECNPVEIAFYQYRKELLNTFLVPGPGGSGFQVTTEKAFSTPRSAEKAWTYYADAKMPEDIKRAAMAGTMGMGPTIEAFGFIEIWHKVIAVAKILADPRGCAIPDEASMQYATAVSVSGHMAKGNADPLHAYLTRMPPEFTVLAWNLALKREEAAHAANPSIPEGLQETGAFVDFAKKFKAVFAGVGAA